MKNGVEHAKRGHFVSSPLADLRGSDVRAGPDEARAWHVGIRATKKRAKIGGLASCKAPAGRAAALLRLALAQVAANFTSRAIALLFFCPCEKSTSPVCPRAALHI